MYPIITRLGLDRGAAEGQIPRWNDTTKRWVTSSVIRNDGTRVGVNMAPVASQLLTLKALAASGGYIIRARNNTDTADRMYLTEQGSMYVLTDINAGNSYVVNGTTVIVWNTGLPGYDIGGANTAQQLRIGIEAESDNIILYGSTPAGGRRVKFKNPIQFTTAALKAAASSLLGLMEFDSSGLGLWFTPVAGSAQRQIAMALATKPTYVASGTAARDLSAVTADASVINFLRALIQDLKDSNIITF